MVAKETLSGLKTLFQFLMNRVFLALRAMLVLFELLLDLLLVPGGVIIDSPAIGAFQFHQIFSCHSFMI